MRYIKPIAALGFRLILLANTFYKFKFEYQNILFYFLNINIICDQFIENKINYYHKISFLVIF